MVVVGHIEERRPALGEWVSGNWEGEAPAEPVPWVNPKRLGRSLALPMASFLVFMGFELPDTLSRKARLLERKKTPLLGRLRRRDIDEA